MESASDTNFSCNSSSGLLRFRSAPISLLSDFTGGEKMFCSGEVNSMHVMSENGGDGDRKKSGFTAVNPQLPPQYPRQMDYRVGCSTGSDPPGQGRIGSGLLRQSSSPAGFFPHLSSQNGYSGVRSIGSYRRGDGGDISPSSSRFKSPMDFSSGLASSLGILSRINEVENENAGPMGLEEGKVGGDGLFFSPELPFSCWNDSSYFAENFSSGIKRELDHDSKLFGATEKCEPINRPNMLSHHLSLPKTSNEIAAMDKFLHFQETVPCKVRAKRGCATHPRSIAERVRRTRISERMRKLQELVPNMDKQTNTADMLDLAVEYIKTLQKQYDKLSDKRANCECSAFQKVISD